MAYRNNKTASRARTAKKLGIIIFPWLMFTCSRGYHLIHLLLLMVFFFVLVSALVGRWKDAMRFSSALGPILVLLIWAGLSILWSVDPGAALRSFLGLAGITGYGIMFSFYYSVEEQLRLLALYMAAVALYSLLLIVFFPSEGIMSGIHAGAWQGVFAHKNMLGLQAAFGVVLFALCTGTEARYRLFFMLGFVVCLALLIGSRSLTGAVSAFAGLTAYAVVKSLKNPPWGLKRRYVAMTWGAVVMVGCLLLLGNLDGVLQLAGRDRTLSSRTELWSLLLEKGVQQPWIGYGLDSFWNGNVGVSAEVVQVRGINPLSAHNSFLDLFLQLGLIGVALFLFCLGRICIPAYRKATENRPAADCWHILFLAYLITSSLTESQLFGYTAVFWMLFVTATCNIFGRPDIRLSNVE